MIHRPIAVAFGKPQKAKDTMGVVTIAIVLR
jgi:hypothetical protein